MERETKPRFIEILAQYGVPYEVLDRAGRIEEVARMLGGVEITATTRRHATEMLGFR